MTEPYDFEAHERLMKKLTEEQRAKVNRLTDGSLEGARNAYTPGTKDKDQQLAHDDPDLFRLKREDALATNLLRGATALTTSAKSSVASPVRHISVEEFKKKDPNAFEAVEEQALTVQRLQGKSPDAVPKIEERIINNASSVEAAKHAYEARHEHAPHVLKKPSPGPTARSDADHQRR